MNPDDAPAMTREVAREIDAAKRYRARERAALVQLAMVTLTDRHASTHEHASARRRLTAKEPDDLRIDHLTADQLATLGVLLDLVFDSTITGNEILRVVAAPKPYESIVAACAACMARRDADWVKVADLDDDSRAVLVDTIAELRRAQAV